MGDAMTTDSGKKLCEYFCDQCGDCMDCCGDQDCIDGGFHSCQKMSNPTPCANCERLEASKNIQTSGMETEIKILRDQLEFIGSEWAIGKLELQRLQKQLDLCKVELQNIKTSAMSQFLNVTSMAEFHKECADRALAKLGEK